MRIRSIKPEWLEDEALLRAGLGARVLSVALILLADDYGRGRCIDAVLAGQVFPFEPEPSRVFRESLASLSDMGFVRVYEVRGQRYFAISNWSKHQKVDKPGKPHVPVPLDNTRESSRESRESLETDPDLDLRISTSIRTPIARESAAAGESPNDLLVRSMRGRQRLRAVANNLDTDHRGKWQHAFAALGEKSESEWSAAATVLVAEAQRPGAARRLTPQHISDYWSTYAAGEAPGPRNGHVRSGGMAPVLTEDDVTEFKAKPLPSWRTRPQSEDA